MRRLLLLSCSQRKLHDDTPLPALRRYDGPNFRVLRRYLREKTDSKLTVLILSAQFGLLTADQLIPYYDHRLTHQRAKELRAAIEPKVRDILMEPWIDIGVCLSSLYLSVVTEELHKNNGSLSRVSILQGGLGKRLTALHSWLRETSYGKK